MIATIGNFDGVHRGHQFLISKLVNLAKKRAEKSLVVTFGNHPLSVIDNTKTPPFLTTVHERVEMIKSLGVDRVEVLTFDDNIRLLSATQFMELLRDRFEVTMLLLGFNNRIGYQAPSRFENYSRIGEKVGIEVVYAPQLEDAEGVSSTKIRALIAGGHIVVANAMLTRPYSLSGQVVHGQGLGAKLGFATANIDIAVVKKIVPLRGVYIADVSVGDEKRRYLSVVNIGVRPTVDKSISPQPSIEAHLIDFDRDIYGATITIRFLERLRAEKTFDDVESLRRCVAADIEAARRYDHDKVR